MIKLNLVAENCASILWKQFNITPLSVSLGFDFYRYVIRAEWWLNVLGHGGLNTPCDYPARAWSCYNSVSVPEGNREQTGNIEFFDNRTNVRTLTVVGAACFRYKFTMKPRAGMLLMFPSYF